MAFAIPSQNGFEAWRKVCYEQELMAVGQRLSKLTTLLEPDLNVGDDKAEFFKRWTV
jgi:hypothetical protein